MYIIDSSVNLYIKKIDIMDEKDIQFIKELDQVKKYLYSIESNLYNGNYLDRKYLYTGNIYGAPYSIYLGQTPIGYVHVSKIFGEIKTVVIELALLKSARGYGYASLVLSEVTKIVFSDVVYDVEKVVLAIDLNNQKSQFVAEMAGFISDELSHLQHEENGFIQYTKMKKCYDR